MSLQKRLDRIREGFEKEAPPEVLAVMHSATAGLRSSGMLENVVAEDMSAPEVVFQAGSGNDASLASLRSRGPVVLTFFRGDW